MKRRQGIWIQKVCVLPRNLEVSGFPWHQVTPKIEDGLVYCELGGLLRESVISHCLKNFTSADLSLNFQL